MNIQNHFLALFLLVCDSGSSISKPQYNKHITDHSAMYPAVPDIVIDAVGIFQSLEITKLKTTLAFVAWTSVLLL